MKKIIRLFAIMGIVSMIASCGSNSSSKKADNEESVSTSENSGEDFDDCENPTEKMFIGKWESKGTDGATLYFEFKEGGNGIFRETKDGNATTVQKIEWHLFKGTDEWSAGFNGISVTHLDGMELTYFNIDNSGKKLKDMYIDMGIFNRVK